MATLTTTDYDIPEIEGWIAGDSRRLEFTVNLGDGFRKNLTDDELSWYLTAKPYEGEADAILSDADAEVDVIRTGNYDETNGEFAVDIGQGTLAGEWGQYWHHVEIDPPLDTKQSWRGRVTLVDAE